MTIWSSLILCPIKPLHDMLIVSAVVTGLAKDKGRFKGLCVMSSSDQ